MKAKFLFGDIVVIEEYQIGVIVKSWENPRTGLYYEVYVRSYNAINDYQEKDIERFRIRHKYLEGDDLGYQNY